MLVDFGLEAEFESLNRAAIEVCREAIDTAADREQWVAGSISTYAPGHDRTRLPNAAVLERNAADQAETLAKAGADLIVLEMVFTVEQAVAMLRGACVRACLCQSALSAMWRLMVVLCWEIPALLPLMNISCLWRMQFRRSLKSARQRRTRLSLPCIQNWQTLARP